MAARSAASRGKSSNPAGAQSAEYRLRLAALENNPTVYRLTLFFAAGLTFTAL
jgi:hypothetical protein